MLLISDVPVYTLVTSTSVGMVDREELLKRYKRVLLLKRRSQRTTEDLQVKGEQERLVCFSVIITSAVMLMQKRRTSWLHSRSLSQ